MEQINRGILKLMQFAAGSHVEGKKTDFGAERSEQTFDALLGQKADESRRETTTERSDKPAVKEKDAPAKEETKTEKVDGKKPSDEVQEENCDVAREVAAAQIVWLVPPKAAEYLVPEQQEKVFTIEEPMIFATNDEPVEIPGEMMLTPVEAPEAEDGMFQLQEQVISTEPQQEQQQPEMIGEEVVETVETVREDAGIEAEAEISQQTNEAPEVEARVSKRESDETGGEAVAVEKALFEEVEAAPIKVAEAPEKAQETPEVEKQVSDKLVKILESGESKVELQLEPVELGKLTIELTRSADGTLHVLLNAENAQTRGLLEKTMGNLQETLSDRGQQNVQITVERGEESQRQENQQYNNFQDDGSNRQHEQQRRDNRPSGDDFLQQLRLGLIPLEDEEDE